jgi:hypothetical protein
MGDAMNGMNQNENPLAEENSPSEVSALVMHIRCSQLNEDIPLDLLHVNPSLSDEMIRDSVERYLQLASGTLDSCSVERHVNGNMSLLAS